MIRTLRAIWALLTPVEQRAAAGVLALTLAGMVLETLSLGLVIPAVLLLLQDSPDIPWLGDVFTAAGAPGRPAVAAAGLAALVAMYVIKTAFLALLAWRQTRFAFSVQARLSGELFATYLAQPWTFHLQRNSGALVQNALGEVGLFTFYGLLPALLLVTEGLILAGVAALLFVVAPAAATVLVVVLSACAWGFQFFTRTRTARWSAVRQQHEALRTQRLQEGLGGAKEAKLLGREAEFVRRFQAHNTASARMWELQQTLHHLPRLLLELLAVTTLALVVAGMLFSGRETAAIVSTVALFAAAAFRAMPSANRLLGAIHSIHHGAPAVERLSAEIALPAAPAPATGQVGRFGDRIELVDVVYTYPDAAGVALDAVSLTIGKGDAVGFIGASGAGKSTLVDVILGLLTPDSGRVLVDGRDIRTDLRGWQAQVGYVPQSVYLIDDTLRRNVAFGLPDDRIDDDAVRRALRQAQLDEFVASLPDGWNTVVGERGVRLSGGQRQRIGIARALYGDAAVLVLDEATSALDADTEAGLMASVRALRGSKTLLIVTHRASTVSHCDRVYRLEGGRLAAASTGLHFPRVVH